MFTVSIVESRIYISELSNWNRWPLYAKGWRRVCQTG